MEFFLLDDAVIKFDVTSCLDCLHSVYQLKPDTNIINVCQCFVHPKSMSASIVLHAWKRCRHHVTIYSKRTCECKYCENRVGYISDETDCI